MPVKKVLKLPRIEEQFRRSMIDKIRGKNKTNFITKIVKLHNNLIEGLFQCLN